MNPVPTSPLDDDLATAPSGPALLQKARFCYALLIKGRTSQLNRGEGRLQ